MQQQEESKAITALDIVLDVQRQFFSPTAGYLILENVIQYLLSRNDEARSQS